ncbi:MAG: DNA-binding response OmpR family regulator [Desulforhopalus sp.]|jgi:DNA-binding response OmpR family regulator
MRTKSVLLVDDERPVLLSLGNYLEKNNFRVKSSPCGEDALAEIRSSPPFDMVITDLIMPGISGIEVLQEIRKFNLDMGVFILTGYGNMANAIEALRLGANAFLLKPCEPDNLVIKMNKFFTEQDSHMIITTNIKIVTICMYCNKIRDDKGGKPGTGEWVEIEDYLLQKSSAHLSHGCCPECYKKQITDLQDAL